MLLPEAIRETKSVCPVCLGSLDASVVLNGGKVFMVKTCPKHGKFEIILSSNSKYYKNLDEFYFAVMSGKNKVLEYELWPTQGCNMNCPICSLGESKQTKEKLDPTCSEIEEFIKESKTLFYTLSGGEPTCRPDLDRIIRILKKYRKTVAMNSNGIKLIDTDYLNHLRKSGLDRVNLQFDGFKREAYLILRGSDLLDAKLKILDNLKSLNIPVVLNATIARNLNEESIGEIIDYAAKNEFVNGITFFTICNIGGARNWQLDNYIVPDEIIGIIEQQTKKRINSKGFYLFQKLYLALKSFLSQKACLYNRVYVLMRDNNTYKPIDELINLDRVEPVLDKYHRLCLKNKFNAKLFLFLSLPVILLINTSPIILKKLISIAFSYFFKTPNYLNTKRFFYLSISTACDPFKIDYSMVENCQNEIVCLNGKSGKFQHQGSICRYGMQLEKPLYE